MSLPRVAIVGRPNVGKSSLLNMLAREKVSIVDPTPGVTRDRVATVVELPRWAVAEGQASEASDEPALVELIDTGGFGIYAAEDERYDDAGQDLTTVAPLIEQQIKRAVEQADLILFVIDAQAGLTALDTAVAKLLRERVGAAGSVAPVLVVANKVDSDSWEAHALEAAGLGLGEPVCVSAKTGRFRRPFLETLARAIPLRAWEAVHDERETAPPMKVAIVGRRNAGKSTFVNTLAGEERVIVSELAGATRDAVDVRFDFGGRSCIAIDTAGFRRKSKTSSRVEWWARQRALQSIERADVAMLLVDAREPVSHIEKRLGSAITAAFKPCVIVINKWDLAQAASNRKGERVTPEEYRRYLDKVLPGLSRAPIVFTTATTGKGVRSALDVAFDLHEQARARVSTGQLNRIVQDIVAGGGAGSGMGTRARIYFATQVAVAPPTIVLVVNDPDAFTPRDERFLTNRLAQRTPFEEAPIRLILRPRNRVDLGELKRRSSRESATGADAEHRETDEGEDSHAELSRVEAAPLPLDLGRPPTEDG